MKRILYGMSIVTMVLMMSIICSCGNSSSSPIEEVGILTAYYAKEDFKVDDGIEYKKGQLICDSNDPFNRIVEQDRNNYRYEGDDTGEEYSWLLPKSKVEKKTYTMNQLPVNSIGDKAYFVSEAGDVACIFWSKINGHKYCSWDGKEVNWKEVERHAECYVLSIEGIGMDNNYYVFEEQLEEKRGSLNLYVDKSAYGGGEDPNNCRYHEYPIGIIEEKWDNKEGWDSGKPAYNEDGKLLVDQWEIDGIPARISIAYIADLDALYIDGELYYRTNDKSKIASIQTKISDRKGNQNDVDTSTPISIEETYSKQDIQSMKAFLEAFYDKMGIWGEIDETIIDKNVTAKARKILKEKGNEYLSFGEEAYGQVASTKITHIDDNCFEVCITYLEEQTIYTKYIVKISVVKDRGSYKIDTIEKGKM